MDLGDRKLGIIQTRAREPGTGVDMRWEQKTDLSFIFEVKSKGLAGKLYVEAAGMRGTKDNSRIFSLVGGGAIH